MSTNIIPFPNTRRENRMPIATPCGQNALGGVVRISRFDAANRSDAGRMVIAGRMADVCAALDQMVAREACA